MRLSRTQFAAAAFAVAAIGAGSGAALASGGSVPADHEEQVDVPPPPPQGSEVIDPDDRREFAAPAGYEGLVDSPPAMTFQEAVDLATGLDAADPPPEGTSYLYGLRPDGTIGRTVECHDTGTHPPEIAELLEGAEGEPNLIPAWECEPLYAIPGD